MDNFLLVSNNNDFNINNDILCAINEILHTNNYHKHTFNELNFQHAYEWCFNKNPINEDVKIKIRSEFSSLPIDINFWKTKNGRKKKLLIADLDSTLIKEESIDEIGKLAGVQKEMEKITFDAMSGNINFDESLKKRVFLLKNLSEKKIIDLREKITLAIDSEILAKCINKQKSCFVIVSGGFLPIISFVAKRLNVKFYHGNEFIYFKNYENEKFLKGYVKQPILNENSKCELLLKYKNKLQLDKYDTIAIGDGANDIKMIREAGLGVSINGKPILNKFADIIFNYTGLKGVLYLQGYTENLIK